MIFDNRIKELQTIVFEISEKLFYSIAKFLGYPDVPGMPVMPLDNEIYTDLTRKAFLSKHVTTIPPYQVQRPENLTQALFGTFPYTMPVEKHFYEHEGEGYYNFYIENYRNIFFLPDWLSSYIQINFNITVDHSNLELFRDSFFYIIIIYASIFSIRTTLYWFITINPYTNPWLVIVDLVDPIYDAVAGLIPCFVGIDIVPTILTTIIGKCADTLNHLVFTMPFMPSEGNEVKMMIDGELKNVIQFHYLPYLWYRFPIPNELREFWYSERPDILDFMEKNYHQLDVNFRPLITTPEIHSTLDSTTFMESLIDISREFFGLI